MMLSGYTINEIQDIIQTAIDSANDDKGHGVESALDDLQSLVNDLDEHQNIQIPLVKGRENVI
ncbi:MAG: hypothetical protein VW961_07010 [Flavobacteriaceae bacterium]